MTPWLVFMPYCPEVAYGVAQGRTGLLVGVGDAALVTVSTRLFPGTRGDHPGDSDGGARSMRLGDRDAVPGGVEWWTRPVQSDLDPGDYRPVPPRVDGFDCWDRPPGAPGRQSTLCLSQALPRRAWCADSVASHLHAHHRTLPGGRDGSGPAGSESPRPRWECFRCGSVDHRRGKSVCWHTRPLAALHQPLARAGIRCRWQL